jgi:hypothetical protein
VVEKLISVKNDNERFFFYERHKPTAEHGQELGSNLPESIRDGEAGDQGWPPTSVPRHVCRLSAAQGCVDRDRVKALGHSSIKVTECHYSPWFKARQDQLETEVRRIWTAPDVAMA